MLITGSGSGIGAAIARRLARPGVGILVHALRNQQGVDAIAAELRRAGAETTELLGDLSQPETAGRLVEKAIKSFGGVDVVVANAGFP
ncbi:MAG: SDR family NAD(P)-dependent oxidoreductase, partial [Beijerinckiaceae bacterium]